MIALPPRISAMQTCNSTTPAPKSVPVDLWDAALAAQRRKDYRGAEHLLNQLLKLRPGFRDGWAQRAEINFCLGKYKRADDDRRHWVFMDGPTIYGTRARMAVLADLIQDELDKQH